MTQPINLIFKFLQEKTLITIWLFEDTKMRIEGQIIGFDEYMNITLDQAKEVNMSTGAKTEIGRILLKGDCITLMQKSEVAVAEVAE